MTWRQGHKSYLRPKAGGRSWNWRERAGEKVEINMNKKGKVERGRQSRRETMAEEKTIERDRAGKDGISHNTV